MLKELFTAVRLTVLTIVVCCVAYTACLWAFAQVVVPGSANGHLIHDKSGTVIGSRQVAQKFTSDKYFHSRPSAVDYNAAGAGGSNLSPASEAFRKNVKDRIQANGATADNPLPVDLATASGSGLDPHISLEGARFQVARVALARKMDPRAIGKLVDESVCYPGGFLLKEPLVNVLELNIKLDGLK